MILSMTGFGKANKVYKNKTINIEIKSLNGKHHEVRMKVSPAYKEKEMEIRNTISKAVKRGKLDVAFSVTTDEGEEQYHINKGQFYRYFEELTDITKSVDLGTVDVLQSILRLPNAIQSANPEIDPEEWDSVLVCINEAVTQLNNFRANEGKSMEADLRKRVNSINTLLNEITPFEEQRIEDVKDRIWKNLEDQFEKDQIDKNRFEQELIYYLEKMDINEEKVRLAHHCTHFFEKMDKPEIEKGRMLNFISQEMGREINTLGAKAYSSDIQRKVVHMKDELEKIKEQLSNVV